MKIFNLPDLGEGLPDAEIHAWHIKEGDTVKVDQLIVSVETAKAVVDVPSPYSGKIKKLYGKAGDVIATGAPLVGFEGEEARKSHDKGTVAGHVEVGEVVIEENPMGIAMQRVTRPDADRKVLPSLRVMAHQLGIDLSQVKGTGVGGIITLQDIKKAKTQPHSLSATADTPKGYEPLRGVRRVMAQAMVQSHREVVPVTIVEDANLHQWKTKQDITGRIVRALCKACLKEPALNAWFDTASMSRQLQKQINIGLALDSVDGLFVPVIRNAGKASAKKIRETVDRFKKQISQRSIPKEDLRDPTIMLSNFGMFAGRYATPIVVPPLVAILGCGKMREAVLVVKGKVAVHKMLPLSLTFDHRAVTGGEATRFLAAFIDDLESAK